MEQKLKLLKSLQLLDHVPQPQLSVLAQALKPVSLVDGQVLFEEGSPGGSLFFVAGGHVRISKKMSTGQYKDLSILGPGDCFGEMQLAESAARSARAWAAGPTQVYELARQDLDGWLKANPELAIGFFTELVQLQSRRLRRTSTELALLFDISSLLLESVGSGKVLLASVLDRLTPHLPGTWSAAAYLYNPFNDEMDFAGKRGDYDFDGVKLPPEPYGSWLDAETYYAPFRGLAGNLGYALFHSHAALTDEDRSELGRTLTTVARLLTSTIQNIEHRNEAELRTRLEEQIRESGI